VKVEGCPGCTSAKFQSVGRSGTAFIVTINAEKFEQPAYEIRHCDNCGIYYKSHILNETDLSRYYQINDFMKWENDRLFPTEQAILAVLSRLPEHSKILDYGCNTGRLMSYMLDRHHCFGVEINGEAAKIATQRGVTILSETELAIGFDAIVLCDVFEHLVEPTSVLQYLCQFLKPKGLLLLCTGNADAAAGKPDLANFWYFRTVEHLCMLSRTHAKFLSQKLGLNLIDWQEMSHYQYGWLELLRQHTQNFAYRQFHIYRSPFWMPILKLIPMMKRAENWTVPPLFTCTKDHALVVFENHANC